MKKIVAIGFLSLFLLGNFSVHGKEVVYDDDDDELDSEDKYEFYEGPPFSHWSVGINAGLYGYGLEMNTHLIPNLKLRMGFNYFGYTFNSLDWDFDYNYRLDKSGDVLVAKASLTPSAQFINGKVLFDILPFSSIGLAITTGVYIGQNTITLEGKTYDENGGVVSAPIDLGDDIIIRPDKKGNVDATLRLGNIVKPYLGLTFGRTIPRNRVGFKVEMGIIYQGEKALESQSIKKNINDAMNAGLNKLELPVNENWLKFWPMLQLQLTYKIK